MPLFFAAVAHNELSLGNIFFELQKHANQVEKITSFETDTIEKVFANPERYKLVYVNVSSNQNALINGLATVFAVELTAAASPMEKVKKVGTAIGDWWRSLPQHAHLTQEVSDNADTVREHIFQPLASIESDIQKILLRDAFTKVFESTDKIQPARVVEVFEPIKSEFDLSLSNLQGNIIKQYCRQFGGENVCEDVHQWFKKLPSANQTYVFNADPEILLNGLRDVDCIDNSVLLNIAEKMMGMPFKSWNDEMLFKFGVKLETAKDFVETFTPPEKGPPPNYLVSPHPPEPHQGRFSLYLNGQEKERVFDLPENLSLNGEVMENMLNTTFDQIGRSLEEKEKIAILCRFLDKHIFGNRQ